MIRMLLMIAMAAALSSCGGGDGKSGESGASTSETGITRSEIILGSQTDLSGPIALLGVEATNGMRMYFDEVNEAGGINGRTIRLVVEDTQYQLPRAIQAANKLINRDKIFAMVLGMGTPMNNALMPILFEKGVPNISPLSGGRTMVEPFKPLQVSGMGLYYDEIRAAVRYFVEDQGKATPCVVYQDTDYGQETREAVFDQLSTMGLGEPAAVSAHKPTESEFTATILRLRNAECDLILMGTVHRDTILILETARKMGLDTPVWVGTNAAFSQSLAEQDSGATEDFYAFLYVTPLYAEDPMSPPVADWFKRYIERFGHPPEFTAILGYRTAEFVAKALQAAGPQPTRASFMAALEGLGEFTDFFGNRLSFGPDDHKGVEASVLNVVRNGRWHVLKESVSY